MGRVVILGLAVATALSLVACHKKKDECNALFETAGEHRRKYKKDLAEVDEPGADKRAVGGRLVKTLKTATDEISDVDVSTPDAKKARDQYVDDLDTLRMALDDSVSAEKQQKALNKLDSINFDADYFHIGATCEHMSITDEF